MCLAMALRSVSTLHTNIPLFYRYSPAEMNWAARFRSGFSVNPRAR